jgi:hypothetical protein
MDQPTRTPGSAGDRRARWRDRGATLVEYALGIALLCVVCLGGISFLTDESSAELDDRSERVGSPDLEEGIGGSTTGGDGGGGSTTDGGDPTPTPPASITNEAPAPSSDHSGNTWDATVTLTMRGDGSLLEGLQITGTWTVTINGVAQPAEDPVSCSTNADGECVFTRGDMEWRSNKSPVTQAVFTVTSYTYTSSDPDQPYPIPPAPAQTITITRPAS